MSVISSVADDMPLPTGDSRTMRARIHRTGDRHAVVLVSPASEILHRRQQSGR